jgi:hypothetical protein
LWCNSRKSLFYALNLIDKDINNNNNNNNKDIDSKDISKINDNFIFAYMDDVNILVDHVLSSKIFKSKIENGKAIGYKINIMKTVILLGKTSHYDEAYVDFGIDFKSIKIHPDNLKEAYINNLISRIDYDNGIENYGHKMLEVILVLIHLLLKN